MTYTYAYPRPMVTVDCIVIAEEHNKHHILLINRKNAPFKGQWALPGGFVDMEETLMQAAERELKELPPLAFDHEKILKMAQAKLP